MYTWDNIKQSVLAKMNLSESEASAMNLPQRYPVYANEAMTQICNAIKPKEMWKEFVVVSEQDANNGVEHDAVVGAEVHLPDDFISFSDNIPLVKRDDGSWDEVYDEYLRKYPDLEQSTFSQKANEAFKVKLDENTPLNETPFLSFLAGESLETRNALAQAVIAKVAYITAFESFCVRKREEIERAGSRELLTHIIIDMSDFTA